MYSSVERAQVVDQYRELACSTYICRSKKSVALQAYRAAGAVTWSPPASSLWPRFVSTDTEADRWRGFAAADP
jgi:hypothetical protein